MPLPVPQEDSNRRRKDLGPLEDWQNLTSKYLEKLQQRKKSEFQGGEWVPWEQENQEEAGGAPWCPAVRTLQVHCRGRGLCPCPGHQDPERHVVWPK